MAKRRSYSAFQSKSLFDFGKHRKHDRHLFISKSPDSDSWNATGRSLTRPKMNQHVRDLLYDLKDCARKRDLQKGRGIHKNALDAGMVSNIYVANALINLYTKCGSMEAARTVFDSINNPDVVSWNCIILGYAENGQEHAALDLFFRMSKEGRCKPKSLTYVAALKACTLLAEDGSEAGKRECLERGRQIHSNIGCHMDHLVQSTLINLYGKCGNMDAARTVFNSIKDPDVVSWSCLILGYAENGQGVVALDLFSRMKIAPNSFIYVAALKACTLFAEDGGEAGKKECLERARQIHSNIGGHMDHFVQSTLIKLYAKCGSMEDARRVFDCIQEPNVVLWNCLILGYAENGQGLVALDLFSRMKNEGKCEPNSLTYVAALKACTLLAEDVGETDQLEYLKRGRQIHFAVGLHMNHFVHSMLINLYAKCCSMDDARTVFDSVKEPDVVAWNCLILGYVRNGQSAAALDMFSKMKIKNRHAPDSMTYVAALKACALLADEGKDGKLECLKRATKIHSDVGHHMDRFVQSTLINLYAKCDNMEEARSVFDCINEPDVVSWTALILGYVENGQGAAALDLFSRMKCAPDSSTYIAALKACTLLAADGCGAGKQECLERGRQIHFDIGCHMDSFTRSTLINFYAKCGCMEDARKVFDSVLEPNVVLWNCVILGYVDNGQGLVGLELFFRMNQEAVCAPNSLTYVAALKACCSIGALTIGRKIHSVISQFDSHLISCLVDFYGKCGSMEEAREVFDLHPQMRSLSTWNAFLAGYARVGDTGSVFGLFGAMQDQGFQPDAITFVCLLSCCSHAGLIEKAWEYFEVMHIRYEIIPSVKHYSCMIDLLGRANRLDEAVALLQKMPCDPDEVTWTALLDACRKWKNAEIGRWAFKSLMDLDQKKGRVFNRTQTLASEI